MKDKRVTECYIREYRCANGVCEKTKYFVPVEPERNVIPSRERKRRINQAEKNITEAKHTASRIVNNNFLAGRDMLVTLTYSDAGMDQMEQKAGTSWEDRDAMLQAARHEMELCLRRARRACKKAGVELKYFCVTSDLDGKHGTACRVHHHIIVNRAAAQLVVDAWKLGEVKGSRALYSAHHGDLTDLVEYLISQTRQLGTEKRYTPSRNLEAPVASAPRLAKNPSAELRVPKGCTLIWRAENYEGRPQKIRYYRPRADKYIDERGEQNE
jgi:hypothetical protein